MLMTLVQSGYVGARRGDKHYRLSFKVVSLARHLLGERRARRQHFGGPAAISEETGETVHYSALERDADGAGVPRQGHAAGQRRFPDRRPLAAALHVDRQGLLAYQDARFTDQSSPAACRRWHRRRSPMRTTSAQELARIRAAGLRLRRSRIPADMRCIAMPVFEKGGEVPAAFRFRPSSRFDLEDLGTSDVAQPHAAILSRELGGVL